MGNKANYIHAINFIKLFYTPQDQRKAQKIRQNPEKWGCDSFR